MYASIRTPTPKFVRALFLFSLLPLSCTAYRVGDAIDAEIVVPKAKAAGNASEDLTLKRNQMPVFGMTTHAKLHLGDIPHFSISLEEGFRSLPYVPLVKGSTVLTSLSIEFVYSRSSGEIHSLHHSSTYGIKGSKGMADISVDGQQQQQQVSLYYTWVEEESVDLNSGAFVMFLAVFIVSIFILFDLCGQCSDGPDDGDRYAFHGSESSVTVEPMAVTGGGSAKYE
jgi:hypothetical protein